MDAYWVELCWMLGIQLNLDKRHCCRQQVECAGFLFDTLHLYGACCPYCQKSSRSCLPA